MSRIIIVGGHGKVALRLARIASEQGHAVTSMIRNAGQSVDIEQAGATAVVADIEKLDVGGVVNLISGYDAIVFSAGAGGGSPERTDAVDRDAAIRTMDAAAKAGISRYVMVSYFGADVAHGTPKDSAFHAYAEAKAAADAYLRTTTLDWTIVAPSSLTLDAGTGLIETKAQGAESSTVSRDDVAAVIAAVIDTPSTIHKMIEFNNGVTPIAEALEK